MHSYYRNTVAVTSAQDTEVDAFSLWKWNDSLVLLVLVDDDQYITTRFDKDKFEKAL